MTYGKGLGAIAVIERSAKASGQADNPLGGLPSGLDRRRHRARAAHGARHGHHGRARRRQLHAGRLAAAERGGGRAARRCSHDRGRRGARPRQDLRRDHGGRQRRPDGRAGRRLRLPRAERRGQDDVAAHAARAHPADCRERPPLRAGSDDRRRARARRRRGLRRGAALLPLPLGPQEPRARRRARRRRCALADRRGARHGRPRRPGEGSRRRLLARHAPAPRHRRCADPPPSPPAPGRAGDRARPGGHARHARAHPRRSPTAASPCCSRAIS